MTAFPSSHFSSRTPVPPPPAAQNYQLKAIEADAIPLIALACRQRLTSLLHAALSARDHRHTATHLRPPPLVSASRKRRRLGPGPSAGQGQGGSDDDSSDEEDELPEHLGGKPKEKPVPAWDQVVYDEQEKLLSVVERVERREENRLRKERGERDERERREKELEEQIKQQEEAEGDGGPTAAASGAAAAAGTSGGGTPAASAVAGTSAAATAATPIEGDSTPKPKKKKATNKNAAAKAADIESRLANQTVSHALGGTKFAWLNTGTPSSPAASGPFAGGGLSKLPPPKFANASSLPKPSKLNPAAAAAAVAEKPAKGSKGKGKGALAGLPGATAGSGLRGLDATPAEHEANRRREEEEEWAKGKNVVELGDLVWAMERERGMGTGRGSGRVAVTKARGGVVGDKRVPF